MMQWVAKPTAEAVERADGPEGPIELAGIVVVTAPD